MSAYDWQPILDEHQRQVAWAATNRETGVTFQVSPDGDALAVWDHSAQGWDYGAGEPAAQPEPEPQPVYHLQAQVDHEQAARIWQEGQDHEEKRLGRRLTNTEMEPALRRWNEARLNGEILDPHDVFRACERDGETRTLDTLNSREDRVEFMVRRIADEEALARGDQLGDAPPPRQGSYDDMRHEDRVAMMVDRMEGRTTAEQAREMTASGYRPHEAEWQNDEEWGDE